MEKNIDMQTQKRYEMAHINISCDRVFSILDDGAFEKEKFGNGHYLICFVRCI